MLQKAILIIFWLFTILTLFTTIAPISNSNEWWIRGWDFPRLHIAIFGLVTAIIGIFLLGSNVALGIFLLLACCAYQSYRIYPYTQWSAHEIALQKSIPMSETVSLISANVLMGNDRYPDTIDLIEREAPDVLFLMETNQKWVDELKPVLNKYETVVNHPLENHYGLIFATNLIAHNAEIVFLAEDKTPTVVAELEGPTGRFFFVGLHPRPPVPGQDTDERDAQIKRAAQVADRERLPVVAMGDFNDVAWSRTSEKFKEYGEFRDPRIGRGMISSFNAKSWWMRFPIDQLYLTEGLGLISFNRLDPIGSDHFPMKAVITVEN